MNFFLGKLRFSESKVFFKHFTSRKTFSSLTDLLLIKPLLLKEANVHFIYLSVSINVPRCQFYIQC